MINKTRILIVEDVATDAELAQREINKTLSGEFLCVDTREAFLEALDSFKPELIISDYQMPVFDGITALKLAMKYAPDTPVIILTAATNEDTAVECMKAGAKDYVIKEHLKRLGQAVLSALDQKRTTAERLEFERTLRKTEERLRELADNLSSAFFVYEIEEDRETVAYLSPGWESIWKIKRDAIITDPTLWISFVHPDDREYVHSIFYKRMLQNPSSIDIQYRIISGDNEIRWIRTKASPILRKDGKLARIIGYSDDITERKRAAEEKIVLEQQLAQAQKLESIGRLAGGVAHDFNNMLSVIIGYSELIKAKLDETSPIMGNIIEIEKAALRSKEITRQLLAFSRKQIISPRSMNLNEMIHSMQKSLSRLIGEDIELIVSLERTPWTIMFDPTQAEQILMNLVVNSRDALSRGGRIEIKTANSFLDEYDCRDRYDCSPGQYMMLSVVDNGVGMDGDTLSRIFEPFFTTKETGKGTGLGLATVYGIVKQNGGCISVASEIGKGTTIDIFLPRNETADRSDKKAEEEEKIEPAKGTILLVEDEEMLVQLVSMMLKTIGYDVIAASGPMEALKICENKDRQIDLLLTDIVMPAMNGNELKKEIESKRPGIKTVFVSGYPSEVIIDHGVLIDGADLIHKPFDIKDLATRIRDALSGNKENQ